MVLKIGLGLIFVIAVYFYKKKLRDVHKISYNQELLNLVYTDIDFLKISTRTLDKFPVKKDEDLKKTAYNNFFKQIKTLTDSKESVLKIDIYTIFLENPNVTVLEASFGVLYFEDGNILPIKFKKSSAIFSWILSFIDGCDISITSFTPNDYKRTIIYDFDKGNPFIDSGTWIYNNAPKKYIDEHRTI